MSEARVFIGPVDGTILGFGADGVPVVAVDDGVEPMLEITDALMSVDIPDAPLTRFPRRNGAEDWR